MCPTQTKSIIDLPTLVPEALHTPHNHNANIFIWTQIAFKTQQHGVHKYKNVHINITHSVRSNFATVCFILIYCIVYGAAESKRDILNNARGVRE